jgi:hypothetical protein
VNQLITACKADTDCVALITCVNGRMQGDPNACP